MHVANPKAQYRAGARANDNRNTGIQEHKNKGTREHRGKGKWEPG